MQPIDGKILKSSPFQLSLYCFKDIVNYTIKQSNIFTKIRYNSSNIRRNNDYFMFYVL